MKILYHHRIASKDGQYVHIEELTNALKQQGHEIIMVSPATVEHHPFGSGSSTVARMKQHIPSAVYELLEFGYSFFAFVKLIITAIKYKPNIIYERYNLFLPAGVWLSRLLNIPLLLEVNAPLFAERTKFNGIALPRLAKWSEDYTWRHADRVLPVTQVLADEIVARGVDKSRITVIPNGINVHKFKYPPQTSHAKRCLGLENSLVLGFTGFVREWHGLDRVVDLLIDNHTNRHLLIVGDGPAKEAIMERAQRCGVANRVTITGIIQRDQIPSYVAAFDIALQPDVVDYASPLKLFEYLALGRAIVAPDKANIREILTHEHNALLFEAGSHTAFQAAVEQLCLDTELRRKISTGAQESITAMRLTWDNNAERVIKLAEALTLNTTVDNNS